LNSVVSQLFLPCHIQRFTQETQPPMALRMKTMGLIRMPVPGIIPSVNVNTGRKRRQQASFVFQIGHLLHAMPHLKKCIACPDNWQRRITQDRPKDHGLLHLRQRGQGHGCLESRVSIARHIGVLIGSFTRIRTKNPFSIQGITLPVHQRLAPRTWPIFPRFPTRHRTVFCRLCKSIHDRKHGTASLTWQEMARTSLVITQTRTIFCRQGPLLGHKERRRACMTYYSLHMATIAQELI